MNNFESFEFRNAELSQNVLLPTHTKITYSTVAGVLDLFIVLRSRMSGIGSLGLSIVLCVISCRGQNIVTGVGGTLKIYYIDSPVLHQEASLQKICALEKTQAANKLIISSCTPNQASHYTTAAIRAYTLLLYHHCSSCVYTYRCKCITPTKLSPPWPVPVRTANITTEGMTF